MPKLSIIVPVYMVGGYLLKCATSIQHQLYKEFETILIDDGSTDECPIICDEFAMNDKRFFVIHQKNAGVSDARNKGLNIAAGENITFVDSDDWIEPEMYEVMMSTNEDERYDVVVCGMRYCDINGKTHNYVPVSSGEYNREQLLEEIISMPNYIGGGCCNKIFKKEKINNIKFENNLSMAEDWIFLFHALRQCEGGIKIESQLYNVSERPSSATRSENELTSSNLLLTSALLLLLLLYRENEPQLEGKAIEKYLDNCARYIPLIRSCGKKTGQAYILHIANIKGIMIQNIYSAWRRKLIPQSLLIRHLYLCIKI